MASKQRKAEPPAITRLAGARVASSPLWSSICALRETLMDAEGTTAEQYRDIDVRSVHFVVATEGGAAGCVLYDPELNRLRQMIVASTRRGSGVGRELVQAVKAEAKKAGRSELLVHAWLQSRRFYARCGFRECGEPRLHDRVPWVPMSVALEDGAD